ncbi:Type III restriction-modification system EcoP15I enzyme mod [Vibrio nigripulchritudo MADA3029]|uniref:site-specific DNA-methyltransferase n=1 Tax=Vibrio nigripulchritudo TaxID=28173 RepID=UPI0003B223D1|nr:site-specific DNA-methyltransferase [Vibrio nigripulchritudo]CCN45999.1 Type III restriction-modification system EcoP15I enzyme mod [Vibrio nigripulchritudo MADA3020]CCN54123.1 Type III restriction-modification system EcoP15I enzyme mod [Vibrio nigripulchritudo MADA3021]CCN61193.1 Type III restriction-modification system EcoP15I enzyme mod [Vibrio nigripulchritudo MADA3029]
MNKETLFSNAETANSKQLEILQKHFPQCFDKQGNFIQEKMLEVVKSSEVELSKESYSLNWLGKSYARLLTNLPPKTLLHEDKEHNQLDANKDSQNLLIKGDNLEVLKHMVNAYSEKVKMIYIDPPYNTGSDGFVYNDDRKFTPQQLSELAGIDLDEAQRILDFTEKGSSSHSAWLTFMYPRLYVARHLLQDDGVIFISIDDNEVGQLRLLCDEIFGQANFLEEFIWIKKTAPNNVAIGGVHEYVLAYSKSNQCVSLNLLPRDLTKDLKYKNPDNDPRGRWAPDNLTAAAKGGRATKSLMYEIVNPVTGTKHMPPEGRMWIVPEKEMLKKIAEKSIYWGKSGDGRPMDKKFLDNLRQGMTASTLLNDVGSNSSASKELASIFDGKVLFETPKPVGIIERFINIGCNPNDLVLDFFAGSGTTAHAVFNINKNKRDIKFISIQLDEKLVSGSDGYKAGYRSIFEITKDRLLKASEKIKQDSPDYKGDLGFKIFETVEDFRVKDEGELTLENHSFFDDAVLSDEQYNTLLTTWCVYDGSLLTTPIQDVDLNGYTAHLCDKRLYLIAPNFNSETVKALLNELDNNDDFEPNKVVFYGNNFDSAKQMELNEALKGYANKKSIELDLVVRN